MTGMVRAKPTVPREGLEDRASRDATQTAKPRVMDSLASAGLAAFLVLVLEIIARSGVVSDLILPAPSQVWEAFVAGVFGSGVYVEHTISTLTATIGGFLCASSAAIAIAGILSSLPRFERIIMPFIVALQTLPKTALAPLLILWMGFGQTAKVTIVALVSFFPVVVNSLQGMHIRDREQFELLESLGSSRWQLLKYVRVPNAVPYIFAGLHIGLIFALIGAVVAELVGSREGLGYILLQEKALFNVSGVFAILFVLLIIGQLLHRAMVFAEKRVAPWAADVQQTVAP